MVQTNEKGPLWNCNGCPKDEGVDLKNIKAIKLVRLGD